MKKVIRVKNIRKRMTSIICILSIVISLLVGFSRNFVVEAEEVEYPELLSLNIADTDIEKGITINCIKDEIEKLVSTLLDNAVKHSYKDSTVNVKLYKEKSSIILKVINTGGRGEDI